MSDIIKTGGKDIVSLLHGKNGELAMSRPFEREIFLFDTYVAGTTHVTGIEDMRCV